MWGFMVSLARWGEEGFERGGKSGLIWVVGLGEGRCDE